MAGEQSPFSVWVCVCEYVQIYTYTLQHKTHSKGPLLQEGLFFFYFPELYHYFCNSVAVFYISFAPCMCVCCVCVSPDVHLVCLSAQKSLSVSSTTKLHLHFNYVNVCSKAWQPIRHDKMEIRDLNWGITAHSRILCNANMLYVPRVQPCFLTLPNPAVWVTENTRLGETSFWNKWIICHMVSSILFFEEKVLMLH